MHNFIMENEIMVSDWLVVSTLMMSISPNQNYTAKQNPKFDRKTAIKISFRF